MEECEQGMNRPREELLKHLLDWLKTAPIQETDGTDAGGVYAWIDEATGERPYLYAEITGYFMTLASHLSDIDAGNSHYWIDRARAAGDWITNVALRADGALLSRKYPHPDAGGTDMYSFENGVTAFFDCAMVGYGLVNTYKRTGDGDYRDAAVRLADFCLRAFESPDGRTRYALYNTRDGAPLPRQPRWSACWGPFEVKGCMFFHELYLHTGNSRYAAFVERLTEDALCQQTESGGFRTGMHHGTTHLHPHNYAVEGLLYLAGNRIRTDLDPTLHRAIDFTFSHCLDRDKGVLQQYSDDPTLRIAGIRSDVLAQSLRSYYLARVVSPGLAWPWEREVEYYCDIMDQYTLPGGGTSYGEDEYGNKHRHANAWCHFFNIERQLYRRCYVDRMDCSGRVIIT